MSQKRERIQILASDLAQLSVTIQGWVSTDQTSYIPALLSKMDETSKELRKLVCKHPAFAGGICAGCGATYQEVKEMEVE